METNSTQVVGREPEIRIFDELVHSKKPEFLAVFGRRRVGKTFLIKKYFESKMVFNFSGAYQATKEDQLTHFFNEYLRTTKGQKETQVSSSWSTAFSYLTDYLYSLKHLKKKQVVFIDELPWLNTNRSGFLPALEYFWNQHGSMMGNLLLIVCGSAASWIQEKILKSKGGLHNRVTQQMRLEPFNLYETQLFCKSRKLKLTQYQIIQLYMVMGGIPFYLDQLKQGLSATQLIDEICFSKAGLLATEYDNLYHSLFKNADKHVNIIETLALQPNGMTRKNLLQKSKLPDGGIFSRTVNDLLESGFITLVKPYGKRKKDSTYRLIDMYSLFYLKFIKGNVKNQSGNWLKISNLSSFRAWSGYAYENICMIHVDQILNKLKIKGVITETASWKHHGNKEVSGAQIDMLINRQDDIINLCEAKFTQNEFRITEDYVAKLRQKRAVFQHVTKTKKGVVTTLITTYPAIQNQYYLEEIHSEVSMEDLFVDVK